MQPYLVNFLTGLFLTAVSSLILGGFVLFAAPRQRLNQVYAVFCTAIAAWSAFEGWLVIAPSPTAALVLERLEHLGVVYLPVLFAHYVLLLVERSHPKFLRANYLIATLFAFLLPTHLVVDGLDSRLQGLGLRFFVEPGPGYAALMLWFFVPVSYGFYHLLIAYRSSTGARKNQMRYAFWGALIGFLGGCGNYLYVYDVEIPFFNPNSTYGVPLYMAMTAYAILRHRLMDISVVLKRTVIYTLLYSISLAVFGFVALFLGQSVLKLDPRLAAVLGLLFVVAVVQPLDRTLTRMTNQFLFREKYRYQQTLKAASAGMGRIRNLPRLLALMARVIVGNVKVTHATLFLKERDKNSFVVVASHGRLKKPARLLRLEETSPLLSRLIAHPKELVVYEELKAQLKQNQQNGQGPEIRKLSPIVKEMERLNVAVCVPSFMDGKLKGLLMLGEKLSGAMYDQEDLDIFSTLANQAALAVENAEAYEELRDTRDQMLQSERLATIGKFAADMAHEIKNPLQAIKTYFQYLPQKRDDPEFQERFAELARSEVDRIDHYVRQLATYTNPRPPQFQPIEIQQVIDSVLALLESDLHKARIDVRKGYSPNELTIEADRDQMKQVFLNLCMNAIEAMPSQNGKPNLLEIVAYPNGKVLVVKVRDTGCGITEEQLPVLFAPFFTTKEKGSGLGLSIVQSILRAHSASIDVQSRVGQGTTITLTLPRRQPAQNILSRVA